MQRSTPSLVVCGENPHEATVVDLGDALGSVSARRVLLAEATVIEAWHGKNAYSDFLIKHGHRPSANQATTIGRLIGARVKADDGKLYPHRRQDRDLLLRKQVATETGKAIEIQRLIRAVTALAANTQEPSGLIDELCPETEEPEIREQLEGAVEWLTRFAQEWKRREAGRTY
ncbi:hypothetical protein ABIA06_003284 [Bradyrhizobium yuanmingense]|uniref:hypothetical protein n=1 Tax=Bradyrhizobium yuanmingense TaxID=108015 RepID=UPI003512B22A